MNPSVCLGARRQVSLGLRGRPRDPLAVGAIDLLGQRRELLDPSFRDEVDEVTHREGAAAPQDEAEAGQSVDPVLGPRRRHAERGRELFDRDLDSRPSVVS